MLLVVVDSRAEAPAAGGSSSSNHSDSSNSNRDVRGMVRVAHVERHLRLSACPLHPRLLLLLVLLVLVLPLAGWEVSSRQGQAARLTANSSSSSSSRGCLKGGRGHLARLLNVSSNSIRVVVAAGTDPSCRPCLEGPLPATLLRCHP
jgi:hypothetical protein